MNGTFTHRLRVRYSECDSQGVVFNAHYVTFFDVALTELWREAIGPYAEMVDAGADMVVAEARVRYLAPAGFDDVLEIAVTPTRLGTTGMTTSIEVRRGETLVALGEMRHVFVAPGGGGKRPIPADVRRGLEPYLRSPRAGSVATAPDAGGESAAPTEDPGPTDGMPEGSPPPPR